MKKFTIISALTLCVCIGSAFAITCFDDELKGEWNSEEVASISFDFDDDEFVFEYGTLGANFKISDAAKNLKIVFKVHQPDPTSDIQDSTYIYSEAYLGTSVIPPQYYNNVELCTISLDYEPGESRGTWDDAYEEAELPTKYQILMQYDFPITSETEGGLDQLASDIGFTYNYTCLYTYYYFETVGDIMTPIDDGDVEGSSYTLPLGYLYNPDFKIEVNSVEEYNAAIAKIKKIATGHTQVSAGVEVQEMY